MNLFTKMLLLIAMLMIPVIILYFYSNQTGSRVVEEQINISNRNRLAHFVNEIEGTLEQASKYSNLISRDPDFTLLAENAAPASRYEYAALLDRVEKKLGLISLSTEGLSRVNLYFPAAKLAFSSLTPITYDERYLRSGVISTQWALRRTSVNGSVQRAFTRHFVEPLAGSEDVRNASVIVEVDLMEDNIVSMLDSFKFKGNNDPFLYKAPGDFVFNSSSDQAIARRIAETYDNAASGGSGSYKRMNVDNKQYLVYHFTSPMLNWTLVDYVPLEDILAPVTRSQNLFYATVSLLVLAGVAAALLLYYNVQVPIRLLTESVSKLKQGEFSVRIHERPKKDFYRLIQQFNEMASQIQHLVEKVYAEEIRSREALMKQLQSQINPHFLYNSLAYLVSMARMKRTEPVISMAYRLADYYKYTTRNVEMVTTVREELSFVQSYVAIMNDQLDKIRFEVSIPEELESAMIPRLTIQPVVENSIVHGLEAKLGEGGIRINGFVEPGRYTLTIEDDGVGMTEEELLELNRRITGQVAEGDSFGLWNVHQRLRYQFGDGSGVTVEHAAAGGVRALLRWNRNEVN